MHGPEYNRSMILGSLLIGLLTAYYFGIRPGITAAAGSAALFILSDVVPQIGTIIYAIIALFIAAVCIAGPRMPDQEKNAARMRRLVRELVTRTWRRF